MLIFAGITDGYPEVERLIDHPAAMASAFEHYRF
jgi:hypothetical protein